MAGNFFGNCLCQFLSGGLFIAGCSFLLLIAFPVTQITLGAVYVSECPAAPLIPVYVMVCGVLSLLMLSIFSLPKFLCPASQDHSVWHLSLLCLVLLAFIWLLFGSYQIYSVYPPNYTKITIKQNTSNNSTPTDSNYDFTLENQNQSLPDLNRTWMSNNNQTLMNLIKTLAISNNSSETNKEHLNTQHARRATAVAPYCNRILYLFAFSYTTLLCVIIGKALVYCCVTPW